MKPKIAIVCDWLVSRGGAERVIEAMCEIFPNAPLYTTIYNEERLPEFKNKKVITSFLQKLPFSRSKHYLFLPLMPYAFESFDLSGFDIVISSCHSCSKGVITKPETLHISYCHSPMRYLWDNCHAYFESYRVPKLLQGRAKKMLHELRLWDRLAADRVDFYIANSQHVQKRISKYYRRNSSVIYPPVNTDAFSLSGKNEKKQRQYYLGVGRLTPYKRFDLLVDTFNELKLPLVIVGSGRDEAKLRKKAGRFVTLVGSVSDQELQSLYQGARALIFPHSEDFGIIPLEAMSCGTPVIALGSGGALETVVPGKTGLFFEEQTVESLKRSILEAHGMRWDEEEIRKHALGFSKEVFKKNLREYVEKTWERWQ